MSTAKRPDPTAAARQAAKRARDAAAAGGPEVRGIYAPTGLHATIKAAAEKIKLARTKDKP